MMEQTKGQAEVSWGRALRQGTLAIGTMLPCCLLVPLLLQQAGMPYPGAYTAMLLTSIVGTLYMAWRRLPLLVLPSLSLTVWLVWLVMLADGLNWQFVLAVQAIAAAVGWLLWQLPLRRRLPELLPPVLHWALPTLLAVLLVLYGLVQGRVIMHSPWAVTALGNLHDPMAYLSLIGLLVLALLWVRRCRGAALWAGLLTAGLALAEGFWVLPASPFLVPEGLDRTALMLNPWLPLPTGGLAAAVLTGLVLVLVLSSLGWSAAEAARSGQSQGKIVAVTFAFTLLGAFLGSVPVTVAPASAIAGQDQQDDGPQEGKGQDGGRRTALVMAAWLLVLLICAPVVRSMADFPVMATPMLVGCGLWLLIRQLQRAQRVFWDRVNSLATAAVLGLALSWNVTAALGAGLLAWVLLNHVSGQGTRVNVWQRILALVWLAYFFFADL